MAGARRRHSEERVRIPRAERVEAMRLRLMEAVIWCIADKGYAATSTNDVVRRAKVSRGALAHHFPTKAALVNAAAGHLVDKRAADFESRMAHLDPNDRTPLAALDILWSFYEQPECRALMEEWNGTAARTSRPRIDRRRNARRLSGGSAGPTPGGRSTRTHGAPPLPGTGATPGRSGGRWHG